MSNVVELARWRSKRAVLDSIVHPAGVSLPFDRPSDAELIVPEVQSAVCSGAYCDDLVGLLPEAVRPGDRVLVVGAGLGVVSTLVAKMPEVARVIAVEADALLAPYAARVHAINGVPWVETVNAVMTGRGTGRVPFFARRDPRRSSLAPDDGSWQQVMMVPLMNMSLMLADERISLVVFDLPAASAHLLRQVDFGPVERILASRTVAEQAVPVFAGDGFEATSSAAPMLFERGTSALRMRSLRSA